MIRGATAAALLTWAWLNQSAHLAFAVGALVVAVVAMRGCPMCWTMGLLETIGERFRVRPRSEPSTPIDIR